MIWPSHHLPHFIAYIYISFLSLIMILSFSNNRENRYAKRCNPIAWLPDFLRIYIYIYLYGTSYMWHRDSARFPDKIIIYPLPFGLHSAHFPIPFGVWRLYGVHQGKWFPEMCWCSQFDKEERWRVWVGERVHKSEWININVNRHAASYEAFRWLMFFGENVLMPGFMVGIWKEGFGCVWVSVKLMMHATRTRIAIINLRFA